MSQFGEGKGLACKYGNVISIHFEFKITKQITPWETNICMIPPEFLDLKRDFYSNSGKTFLYTYGNIISTRTINIGESIIDSFSFVVS